MIKYQYTEVPLEILRVGFLDYLKTVENKLKVRFDFLRPGQNNTQVYCTLFEPLSVEKKKVLENIVLQITEKLLTVCESEDATPIEIQWELL